jgi:hypothetical protein
LLFFFFFFFFSFLSFLFLPLSCLFLFFIRLMFKSLLLLPTLALLPDCARGALPLIDAANALLRVHAESSPCPAPLCDVAASQAGAAAAATAPARWAECLAESFAPARRAAGAAAVPAACAPAHALQRAQETWEAHARALHVPAGCAAVTRVTAPESGAAEQGSDASTARLPFGGWAGAVSNAQVRDGTVVVADYEVAGLAAPGGLPGPGKNGTMVSSVETEAQVAKRKHACPKVFREREFEGRTVRVAVALRRTQRCTEIALDAMEPVSLVTLPYNPQALGGEAAAAVQPMIARGDCIAVYGVPEFVETNVMGPLFAGSVQAMEIIEPTDKCCEA